MVPVEARRLDMAFMSLLIVIQTHALDVFAFSASALDGQPFLWVSGGMWPHAGPFMFNTFAHS